MQILFTTGPRGKLIPILQNSPGQVPYQNYNTNLPTAFCPVCDCAVGHVLRFFLYNSVASLTEGADNFNIVGTESFGTRKPKFCPLILHSYLSPLPQLFLAIWSLVQVCLWEQMAWQIRGEVQKAGSLYDLIPLWVTLTRDVCETLTSSPFEMKHLPRWWKLGYHEII